METNIEEIFRKIPEMKEVSPEMFKFIKKNAEDDDKSKEELDFKIYPKHKETLIDDEKMIKNAFKKVINLKGDYNIQKDYNK